MARTPREMLAPLPPTTAEQLLPVVRVPERIVSYVPPSPLETVLGIGQTAEETAKGSMEAGAILKAVKGGGIRNILPVLKRIVPAVGATAGSVAVDWALPNRGNDMDEIAAIKKAPPAN